MRMEQNQYGTGYKGISQAALARAIGMSPSNFNQKIKRDTFTDEELKKIADALGAIYIPASLSFQMAQRYEKSTGNKMPVL